jgi:hypothetical protein
MRKTRPIVTHSPILLVLLALCAVVFVAVITRQTADQVAYADNTWYLNRAQRYQRGEFEPTFAYTLLYPIAVGGVNRIVPELPAAGMVTNSLILAAIMAGTYGIGAMLYRREVGIVGAVMIALNGTIHELSRLFWADTLLIAVTTGAVLVTIGLVRRLSWGWAVVLGLLLAAAPYTRFEGIMYTVLVPIGGVLIYLNTRRIGLAARLTVISGGIGAAGCVLYLYLLFRNASSGDDAFALFRILAESPLPIEILLRRVSDSLSTGLSHWPFWAWWIALAGVIWAGQAVRWPNVIMLALIGFNLVYTAIISVWPYPRQTAHLIPFSAVLIGAGVCFLAERAPRRAQALIMLCPLLILPVGQVIAYPPPLAYRESEWARDAAQIDRWLADQGRTETLIYTFCPEVIPFSTARFYRIYRLALGSDQIDFPDGPANLIRTMREADQLFMTCGGPIYALDWIAYFDYQATGRYNLAVLSDAARAEKLEEIGRVGKYIFYRGVRAE